MNYIAYCMLLCHIYLAVQNNLFKQFKQMKINRIKIKINNKMQNYFNKYYNILY